MDNATRALLAEGEASQKRLDELLSEIDAALEAYGTSINRGLALAAEMREFADSIDAGLADSQAELMEWF